MKLILLVILAIISHGCAPQQLVWSKPGAVGDDYKIDATRCDYEATAFTQGTNYSYRTDLGREIDRAIRKSELFNKCMASKGWTSQNKDEVSSQKSSWKPGKTETVKTYADDDLTSIPHCEYEKGEFKCK